MLLVGVFLVLQLRLLESKAKILEILDGAKVAVALGRTKMVALSEHLVVDIILLGNIGRCLTSKTRPQVRFCFQLFALRHCFSFFSFLFFRPISNILLLVIT